MNTQFVAVSGVTTKDQLDDLYRVVSDEGVRYPVCMGFQVSHKSINQGTANPRQPSFNRLGELTDVALCSGFLPSVHYYAKENAVVQKDLENIAEQVFAFEGDILLQFNTLPQPLETLRLAKKLGFASIFKVAVAATHTKEHVPVAWQNDQVVNVDYGSVATLVDQVAHVAEEVDYAMFDPSHGTGVPLTLEEGSVASQFGRAIYKDERFSDVGLVYAGGLGPENIRNVLSVLEQTFPGKVSVDAESAVRTEDNLLDMNKVRRYLCEARDVLQR